MAEYKVSYKVLKQQGDELKSVAKLVDGYADRVTKITGKLGNDEMLAEIRKNLGKLREQLGESRAVLNTAGEFLSKTVDGYSGAEVRQVKNVDGTKAHNRDFYKNPTVVASAGGASGGGGSASTVTNTTTNNYTDNSVTNVYAAPEPSVAAAMPEAVTPVAAQTLESVQPVADVPAATDIPSFSTAPVSTEPAPAAVPAPPDGGMSAGAKAAVGTAGAAAVAAGALGGLELKKRSDAKKQAEPPEGADDEYDPEVEMQKAIARVRELEQEE